MTQLVSMSLFNELDASLEDNGTLTMSSMLLPWQHWPSVNPSKHQKQEFCREGSSWHPEDIFTAQKIQSREIQGQLSLGEFPQRLPRTYQCVAVTVNANRYSQMPTVDALADFFFTDWRLSVYHLLSHWEDVHLWMPLFLIPRSHVSTEF